MHRRSYKAITPDQQRSGVYNFSCSCKEKGEQVDTRNITKHKNDVFRLSQLITGDDTVVLCDEIKSDMTAFLVAMLEEDVDLKNLHIRGKKESILEQMASVYNIELGVANPI